MINVIVFIVLFILLITFLYVLRGNMHKIIKPNMRKYVFIIYFSLLLLFTAVFFFVQPNITTMENSVESPPFLYELIETENNKAELELYKVNEWDMTIKDDEIRLQVKYSDSYAHMYIPVVVIEDEAQHNEAHIVHYETPTVLDGVDISMYVNLPNIEVENGGIIAHVTGELHEQEFYSIQNPAVLGQFAPTEANNDTFFDLESGEVGLVVTVPKGTTIIADVDQFDVIKK